MNDLPATLEGMLERIERRAPRARVELGLDRVRRVFDRLAPDLSATRIVSVAGTNGKGSTVAFLQHIADAAGIRSVAYTSPHILRFAERVRIDGEPASDDALADALARVERARGETPLTWFEHVTLAALTLAGDVRPDWLIAEVGMGGRLDAVNVLDADVAVITSIGLDHQRWLGRTRAAIAREKCGIARAGRPVVVGEKRRPDGMTRHLQRIGATALLAGRDFDWRWRRGSVDIDLGPDAGAARLANLRPGLPGRHQAANAASAAAAASLLAPGPDRDALVRGLERARLRGVSSASPAIRTSSSTSPTTRPPCACCGRSWPGCPAASWRCSRRWTTRTSPAWSGRCAGSWPAGSSPAWTRRAGWMRPRWPNA